MGLEADWFDYAHGFSGDDGAWDRLRQAYSSLPDLEFEIQCGGELHPALMTQSGLRLSHSNLELERALNALGGDAPGCLRVHRALEYIRTAEWDEKPDWTLLLKSDSELQAEMSKPWGPSRWTLRGFGTLRGPRVGEETTLLRDLALLPQAARRRVAASLVLHLSADSRPVLRKRAAQVCLRLLEADFQPDRNFEEAVSIIRVMMMEEKNGYWSRSD